MIKTHKIELESFIVIVVAAAIGAGVGVVALQGSFFSPQTKISLPVMQTQDNTDDSLVVLPSPTVSIPKPQTTSQISPDGRKLLTMTQTTNQDKTKNYSIVASDADGGNEQTIYTASASAKASMSIPFNTWSPDDKFVFVNRTDNAGTSAIIMRADGAPLTSSSQTFDAKALFDARNTGNNYQEATGWASETLVIINTVRESGDKGPSYWLEVPSGAIIPLSVQF
jgi:hypothetical protein